MYIRYKRSTASNKCHYLYFMIFSTLIDRSHASPGDRRLTTERQNLSNLWNMVKKTIGALSNILKNLSIAWYFKKRFIQSWKRVIMTKKLPSRCFLCESKEYIPFTVTFSNDQLYEMSWYVVTCMLFKRHIALNVHQWHALKILVST